VLTKLEKCDSLRSPYHIEGIGQNIAFDLLSFDINFYQ
jgi:hypothetical protein